MTVPYYQERLRRELEERLVRNRRYSLRAFARALEVPVSTLSRALSGKRSISLPAAKRIADGLGLEPRERGLFFDSLSTKESAPNAALHDTFRPRNDRGTR